MRLECVVVRVVLGSALAIVASCTRPIVLDACARNGPCWELACNGDGDCPKARTSCEAGDANACEALGRLYATTFPPGRPFDRPALAESYVVRACRLALLACDGAVDLADMRACQHDFTAATRLLRVACAERYPPACVRLAGALVEGVDVPRDTEQAARLFAWACDHGDAFPAATTAGETVPHDDPMSGQVAACVGSEALTEVGLAGSVPPAHTTPEQAQALDRERRKKLAGAWAFDAVDSPAPILARLRKSDADDFAKPAAQLAAEVHAARESPSEIRLCGPIAGAPAVAAN